jgi:hypothetical protein
VPKSSIAIRTPSSLDRHQPARGLLGVAHQRRLGDLDRQRTRIEPAVDQRFDVGDELVGVELAGRRR